MPRSPGADWLAGEVTFNASDRRAEQLPISRVGIDADPPPSSLLPNHAQVENCWATLERPVENLIAVHILENESSRKQVVAPFVFRQFDLHSQGVAFGILDDPKQPPVVNVDVGDFHPEI